MCHVPARPYANFAICSVRIRLSKKSLVGFHMARPNRGSLRSPWGGLVASLSQVRIEKPYIYPILPWKYCLSHYLNVMHFGILTDRNMVYTDRYSASILDNPPVAGGGGHSREVWESCAAGALKPWPHFRQKLLILLPSLRQKTLLSDPDLCCFAYTWHTKLSNFLP